MCQSKLQIHPMDQDGKAAEIDGKAQTSEYLGLKEMMQNGAKEIPSDFILPPHLQPGMSSVAAEKVTLPIIDLSGINDAAQRRQIVTSIADACREWGFFQVVGHGVPTELRQRMLTTAQEFFRLPLSDKSKFVPQEANGPCPMPIFGQTRKTTAGYHSWRDVFKHKSIPAADKEVQNWPSNPHSYRGAVMEYSQAAKKVTDTLLELIAEGLNLNNRQYLRDILGGERMNYVIMSAFYPRCPQPELALGVIGHTDPNPMTILIQDEPGLEVRKDGSWIPVTPVSDGFVVNIGDVLQVISNDRLISCEHRVVTYEKQERTSVMLFVQPKTDQRIAVAPDFVTDETPSRYSDTTWSHFLISYGLKGLDCKVTDFLTKQ